ncbi:MAG TPA: CBS domain-containing protein [Candidatus Thermoplasmatota archaeon]|nr:CBS domain-containing protein [Candidatus Thermoplasmatota archaeon]
MTKDVVSVDKDARLQDVLDTMVKQRVSKLVVLDKGQIVGVLTDGDIADELGAIKNRGVPATHLHASSAMRRKFPSVAPDTEARALLEAFVEQEAQILPVLHDRQVLGVVTGSDLLSLVQSATPLADVMTASHLQVVAPSDRVIHARRMMLDHGIERLPVLEHGALVGILGELDIAVGLARFKGTVADHHQAAAIQRFLVQEVCQRTVVTATPETTARDAVALMRKNDVGALPVLRGERLVGICTRSDLLRLIGR